MPGWTQMREGLVIPAVDPIQYQSAKARPV